MRHAACLRSSLPPHLEQFSEWAEVDVQVLLLELEVLAKLFHLLLEQHECLSEPLDLFGRQRLTLDPPQSLALHQLADQLDESQHELSETLLEALAVGICSTPPGRTKAHRAHRRTAPDPCLRPAAGPPECAGRCRCGWSSGRTSGGE